MTPYDESGRPFDDGSERIEELEAELTSERDQKEIAEALLEQWKAGADQLADALTKANARERALKERVAWLERQLERATK